MKKIDLSDRKTMFNWAVDRNIKEEQIKEIFYNRHSKFDKQKTIDAIEYGMSQYNKSANLRVIKLHDPIQTGKVNIVCKAVLTDGTKIVVRIHPQDVINGYFWPVKVASEMTKKIGVPTFETYFVDTSHKKFDFEYMLIEDLGGENMKISDPVQNKKKENEIEEMGYYLAKIHSIRTEKFGFFSNLSAQKDNKLIGLRNHWKDFYYASLENNLDYLTKTNTLSKDQRINIETIINSHEDLLKFNDPRLLQNDLVDWNELVNDSHIVGIIDWDECCSGDPIADFSNYSVFFPLSRIEILKKGYQKFSSLPPEFDDRFHYYRIRYIVAKMTLRKKIIGFQSSAIKNMLDYSIKILRDEFDWYGI